MPPPLRCPLVASATACAKQSHRAVRSRCFSSTAHQEQRITRARQQLFRWLDNKGQNYLYPLPDQTNYLTIYDRVQPPKKEEKDEKDASDPTKPVEEEEKLIGNVNPFPRNSIFVSEPILSDQVRENIWRRIMQKGHSVREVSVSLGVEMRRVGAVVRLKEIEKEWLRIGKPLARPYADAVALMLPRMQGFPDGKLNPFESINDVTLHAATSPQIFHPTSESRYFTRVDAARVFDEKLLPIDDRIPHPQLKLRHQEANEGLSHREIMAREQARNEAAEKKIQAVLARKAKKAAAEKIVDTQRWRFRFTDINVDDAGKSGRGERGVGWRYGQPLMDRKKGMVKIPTKV